TPNQGIGLLFRNGEGPVLRNAVVMGYAAGFDQVADASPGLEISNTAFFAQLADNLAYAEDAGEVDMTSPYFDDDNGFDEKAFLLEAGRGNTITDPQVARCFNADTPGFAPASALAGATPPNDGFFEASATFRGAVKDANDRWLLRPWL